MITYPLLSLILISHLNNIYSMFAIIVENFGYCNLDELETLAAGKFEWPRKILCSCDLVLIAHTAGSHLSPLTYLHYGMLLFVDLDKYDGNFFEHSADEEVLEKEIQDRKDVADILRLQNELRLRMNYLEDANLFADDVHKETERFPEQAW